MKDQNMTDRNEHNRQANGTKIDLKCLIIPSIQSARVNHRAKQSFVSIQLDQIYCKFSNRQKIQNRMKMENTFEAFGMIEERKIEIKFFFQFNKIEMIGRKFVSVCVGVLLGDHL